MAVTSLTAADFNGSQVTVHDTDDPAEGGGSTLQDIVNEAQSIVAATHEEDTAHSTGDTGLGLLAVRNDTLASLVDTDGDYAPLQVNSKGRLYAEALIKAKVLTSAPSYSDGATEVPWLDSKGRVQTMDQNLIQVEDGNSIEAVPSTDHVVAGGSVSAPLSVHKTQNGTGNTTLVASSTGDKIRVFRLKVQQKDSSNSGSAVLVTIQDASSGTVLEEIPCASYGDGAVLQAPTSGLLFETGEGNALEMTADASVAVSVSATFVKA